MALYDRVRETSTTTGTGNFTLAGAVSPNFVSFHSVVGTIGRFYYAIVHETLGEWECGVGILTDATTLQRETILESTNSDNAVNFSAGTKEVFVTAPADRLKSPIQTEAYSATITFDLSETNKWKTTLTGNPTLALAKEELWDTFTIELIQDGAGSRTVTWWSGISWDGGSAPTLITTPNKADRFVFFRTGANTYQGFHVGTNL